MNQDLTKLTAPLGKALKQYHTTIAIVVLALLIILAIFRLYQLVAISNETGVEGYKPTPKASAKFDDATIKRVNNLRTANESEDPLQFPPRQSPFVE